MKSTRPEASFAASKHLSLKDTPFAPPSGQCALVLCRPAAAKSRGLGDGVKMGKTWPVTKMEPDIEHY